MEQETNLSQQLDQPLQGFVWLLVQVVVQFCPAALPTAACSFLPKHCQLGAKPEN
jgi:hypothetical protein